jgi:ligand-binding SRPBCC domain-containing protein
VPIIRLETVIDAPIERCFDLTRSVEAHIASTSRTKERAVAGVITGLLGMGDTVTWEAVHFWVKQQLTSKITQYDRPHLFTDKMVRGAFHSFTHTHEFRPAGRSTLMLDTFTYKSPFGPIGILADRLFLERYMRNFLKERALHLKRIAESDQAVVGSGCGDS